MPFKTSISSSKLNIDDNFPEKDLPLANLNAKNMQNGSNTSSSNSSNNNNNNMPLRTNNRSLNVNSSSTTNSSSSMVGNNVRLNTKDYLAKSNDYYNMHTQHQFVSHNLPSNSSNSQNIYIPAQVQHQPMPVYLNQMTPIITPQYVTMTTTDRMLANNIDLANTRSMLQNNSAINYHSQFLTSASNLNYVPTQATFNSMAYSNNTNDSLHQILNRRENEIERLKMKIISLEQQQSNDSIRSMQNTFNKVSLENNEMNRMKNMEYGMMNTIMHNDLCMNEARDTQVVKLENLLNEREYEIQELTKKFNNELNKLEKDLSKYKSIASTKEEDLLVEKNKHSNHQKEVENLKAKLKECNEYITKLPTIDEVKESEKKFQSLENENQELKTKIAECDKKLLRAKHFIKEKNNEVQDHLDRIQRTEMEKEKIILEFKNYKEVTQNVGELMEKCNENSSLKAELDIAKKMLANMQEKNRTLMAKHEEEIEEFNEKLRLENDVSESLRIELSRKEETNKKMEESVRDIAKQNQSLISENLNLKENIKSFEVLVSADSLKLLQILFKELNDCSYDLESLVSNCIDIYNGKTIDVCSLLGVSGNKNRKSDDLIDLTDNEFINNVINSDYLIKKTNEIRELKKKLVEVRRLVSDEYAEKIGSNMSCITQ